MLGKISLALQVARHFSNPFAIALFLRNGLPKGEELRVKVRNGVDFSISRNADRWLVERILQGGCVDTVVTDDYGECFVIDGIKLRQKTSDAFIYSELFLADVYEESLTALSGGDVVLDIGAHIGLFCIRAAERGCRVFAYEAHPENYALAAENIRSSGVERVQLSHRALWSCTGESLSIIDPGQGRTAEYSVRGGRQDVQGGRVETVSLEDVFRDIGEQPIALLKMDIEGAEYEVFMKAPTSLFPRVQAICLEYHEDPENHFSPSDLEKLLVDAGFRVKRSVIDETTGLFFGRRIVGRDG